MNIIISNKDNDGDYGCGGSCCSYDVDNHDDDTAYA